MRCWKHELVSENRLSTFMQLCFELYPNANVLTKTVVTRRWLCLLHLTPSFLVLALLPVLSTKYRWGWWEWHQHCRQLVINTQVFGSWNFCQNVAWAEMIMKITGKRSQFVHSPFNSCKSTCKKKPSPKSVVFWGTWMSVENVWERCPIDAKIGSIHQSVLPTDHHCYN